MKTTKMLKKICMPIILCGFVIIFIFIQPENIIRNRINRKYHSDIISLSNVIINNSSEITLQLQTYSCRPMDLDDGKALSEFIDCIKADITKFDKIDILLNKAPILMSIKMKRNNDLLYISEFNCMYTEIYTDVLSCFDLSKTEKMVYRGEAIASYESIFSQMKELKRLSIFCKQDILSADLNKLVQSLPLLERLDFYVSCDNKEILENIGQKLLDLEIKYPNVNICYNYVY